MHFQKKKKNAGFKYLIFKKENDLPQKLFANIQGGRGGGILLIFESLALSFTSNLMSPPSNDFQCRLFLNLPHLCQHFSPRSFSWLDLFLSVFCRTTFAGGSFEALIHPAHLHKNDATLFFVCFHFERNVLQFLFLLCKKCSAIFVQNVHKEVLTILLENDCFFFLLINIFSKSTHPQRKITERFQLRGRKRPGSVTHPPSNRVNKFLSHVSASRTISNFISWPSLCSGNRGTVS